jgi:hypothetical protein
VSKRLYFFTRIHIKYLQLHSRNIKHARNVSALGDHNNPVAPPSLLFNEYCRLFPQGEISESVKRTSQLHLVLRLRISAAVTPLPHMPSLTAQGYIYLHLYLTKLERT